MKVNWNYIKAFALFALIVFLYGFSAKRNAERRLSNVSVQFTNGENLYITEETVNKLLIVNKDSLPNKAKEILALNTLETVLNQHAMIKNAEVYLTVNGELGAVITQRKPIARVYDKAIFYIDTEGKKMPLSNNYSARVPVVSGIKTQQEIEEIYPLLNKIEQDEFLTKHITSIAKTTPGNYILKLRGLDFEVSFGEISTIDKKINNLKAFYNKTYKDKKLNQYKKVSLQFENQVVGTKK